jgi:(p)ppGpp synthase/HD superfamily hydrolase
MFRSIKIERHEKLLTLYTNHTNGEWKNFLSVARKLELNTTDLAQVQKVYNFAICQHYGSRDIDRYYVSHPIRVARFIAHWLDEHSSTAGGKCTDTLISALLHSVLEKKILTPEELTSQYGAWVSNAAVTLTPNREALASSQGKREYYGRLARAPHAVQALKIFDKIDNLFILCINPNATIREEYLREVEKYLMPLAKKVTSEHVAYIQELIEDNRELGFYLPADISIMQNFSV